jgi:class 3 adenylate cyclase
MAELTPKSKTPKSNWQAQAARHALFSEVVLLIAKTSELDALLKGSINKLKWIIDVERCTLALLGETGDTYRVHTLLETRRDLPTLDDRPIPATLGIAGQVITDRQFKFLSDMTTETADVGTMADPMMEDGSILCVMALPVIAFDKVLGCLTFGQSRPGGFDEDDFKVAQSFATHLGLAIDRWQQTQKLRQAEANLRQARDRAEEASVQISEKNRMLEVLSNQLSKYVSPQVYDSIFSGAQSVEIASKRKKLTIFFSDIADFTGITDSLESEELTNLLNHYLTEMSKIALDHGATIDKYVGDAIVAFFGDPETRGVKEDARSCVNMAIAMQRRMRELRSEWLEMGLERPFELRVGINTGFCTVGNFGSEARMDYTIIGNEVNLAARLEALAEVGGILVAHETHSLVKDKVLAEEGATVTVKGSDKPIRTYSVVGLYDDLAEKGQIIREEEGGVRVLVEMKTGGKAAAIQVIETVLSRLKD